MPRGVFDHKAAAEKRKATMAAKKAERQPQAAKPAAAPVQMDGTAKMKCLVERCTAWKQACHILTGDPRYKAQADYCLARFRETRLVLLAHVDAMMQAEGREPR